MTPRKSKAKSGVKINWDARPPFKTKPPAIIIPQPKLKDNLPPDISWDNDPVSENKLHYRRVGQEAVPRAVVTATAAREQLSMRRLIAARYPGAEARTHISQMKLSTPRLASRLRPMFILRLTK